MGTLLFILCSNGLPKIINNKSLTILFADDTSIISLQSKSHDFENVNDIVQGWVAQPV